MEECGHKDGKTCHSACKSRTLYVAVPALRLSNNSCLCVPSTNFTFAKAQLLHISRHTLEPKTVPSPGKQLSMPSFDETSFPNAYLVCFVFQSAGKVSLFISVSVYVGSARSSLRRVITLLVFTCQSRNILKFWYVRLFKYRKMAKCEWDGSPVTSSKTSGSASLCSNVNNRELSHPDSCLWEG